MLRRAAVGFNGELDGGLAHSWRFPGGFFSSGARVGAVSAAHFRGCSGSAAADDSPSRHRIRCNTNKSATGISSNTVPTITAVRRPFHEDEGWLPFLAAWVDGIVIVDTVDTAGVVVLSAAFNVFNVAETEAVLTDPVNSHPVPLRKETVPVLIACTKATAACSATATGSVGFRIKVTAITVPAADRLGRLLLVPVSSSCIAAISPWLISVVATTKVATVLMSSSCCSGFISASGVPDCTPIVIAAAVVGIVVAVVVVVDADDDDTPPLPLPPPSSSSPEDFTPFPSCSSSFWMVVIRSPP